MMTEPDGRAAVVAEAMTWISTPWHHNSAIKGVGVDCARFPLAVYSGVGLIEPFDPKAYARDHMLHSDEERYLGVVLGLGLGAEIKVTDVGPGDLLVWKFGRVFSHGALVTDWPQVIHATVKDAMVVLADADRDVDLIDRPVRAFSYWARADVR